MTVVCWVVGMVILIATWLWGYALGHAIGHLHGSNWHKAMNRRRFNGKGSGDDASSG